MVLFVVTEGGDREGGVSVVLETFFSQGKKFFLICGHEMVAVGGRRVDAY